MGYSFPPASPDQVPSFNTADHHYFPETQHTVSYAFLDYYRDNGGLDVFGYPLSEFRYENGRVVQYFQRARMEWHPEASVGSQVFLANLGEAYVEWFAVSEIHLASQPPPGESPLATPLPRATRVGEELRVSASVRYPITGRTGTQTVSVYVDDERGQPVEGAAVTAVIHYRSGDQVYELNPTGASGGTSLSFAIQDAAAGAPVAIDVTATYGNLSSAVLTSFLVWE
jgi:hypothetical protein